VLEKVGGEALEVVFEEKDFEEVFVQPLFGLWLDVAHGIGNDRNRFNIVADHDIAAIGPATATAEAGIFATFGTLLLLYIVVMWLQTLSYAWTMLITRSDLKLGQMLRNGALISFRYPFHNLLSSAFIALLLYASVLLPPLIILVIPPVWALLMLHNLYLLAPEIVPQDAQGLSLVG